LKIFSVNKNIATIPLFLLAFVNICAQQLKVTYSQRWGLAHLSYKGISLLDISSKKGEPISLQAFYYSNSKKKISAEWSHISGTHWDEQNKIYTIDCRWGSLMCKYTQSADTLFFNITFVNKTQTDTFYGVNFFPIVLSLDKRPSNFRPQYPYYSNNIKSLKLIAADLDSYKILLESTDINEHSYLGFLEESNTDGKNYYVWSSNQPFIGMTDFDNRSAIRLAPGKSYSYSFAMKFLSNSISLRTSAAASVARFTAKNPSVLKWRDRRPIGVAMLSSYNESISNRDNPRRWTMADNHIDNSPAGKLAFRRKLMDYADGSIAILQKTNAQGAITWDIEGQQYPHPLSYIGSPDLLSELAPEMNELADEYFQRFTKKGLKTGICIRPDSVVFNKEKNWIAHVAVKDPAATMIRKIAYARKRWGCSLFYVDSNVDPSGQPMDPVFFQTVEKKYPDVLLIPEHESLLYYACAAPYGEFQSKEYTVSSEIKQIYPDAFMVLMTSGFPRESTAEQQRNILKESAAAGNILLFRCWYNDEPVSSMLKSIYQNSTGGAVRH